MRYPDCQLQPPCATPSHLCNTQINLCAMISSCPFFSVLLPTNQTVGRTWRDTDFYCRQRRSREGVKGAVRGLKAEAAVYWRRGLPPSPLNDVCRLSNARVKWNTCDCLKCCNPRFLLPFPPPHTRLHFPLPYIFQTLSPHPARVLACKFQCM